MSVKEREYDPQLESQSESEQRLGHQYGVYPFAGLEYWTGLLDWTTGLIYAYRACGVSLMSRDVAHGR